MLAAMVVLVYWIGLRGGGAGPWPALVAAASSVAYLVRAGGWAVTGGWLILALMVGGIAWSIPRRAGSSLHPADAVAAVGWAGAFLAVPGMMAQDRGGWLAPIVLLVAIRVAVRRLPRAVRADAEVPLPPSREVRGTLSLRGVVAADVDGLPRTVPLDLELRAGESLAVLCDSDEDAVALIELLAGRRPPVSGEVVVDGVPIRPGDRLVAVVAPGERFLAGGIESNLAALCGEFPDRDVVTAVIEACAIGEVEEALGEEIVNPDGWPLSAHHRMLLQAARVIPSHYRIVVVFDPMPWVNPVRGELWRSAVVRASVGRTAIWITSDRDLAGRAAQRMGFRNGALRPPAPEYDRRP
jgi:ABC-type multidrug transport system fused ATPase/permease subunit